MRSGNWRTGRRCPARLTPTITTARTTRRCRSRWRQPAVSRRSSARAPAGSGTPAGLRPARRPVRSRQRRCRRRTGTAPRVADDAGTERLHAYWVHGEGALKIRWGEPGDFDRCVHHLGKYIADPKGYCNLAHHAALGIYPATHAKLIKAGRDAVMPAETRAPMDTASQNDLPDDAFAYIEPGGSKDSSGRTVPRSLRHFPVHDAAHTRNALARASQSPFGAKAMPKIRAAAKKFGIQMSDSDNGRSAGKSPGGGWDQYEVERRFTSVATEIRSAADGQKIAGYAAVFGQPSRNLGGFIEIVGTGAFNQ